MNSEKTPVNRKTGRLIAKNLIILVVLVAVCAFSIWSWFTNAHEAKANGISVTAEVPKNLEMSLDLTEEKVFSNVVKLSDAKFDEETKIIDRVILDDITGDGYSFCLPDMTQGSAGASPNINSDKWLFDLGDNQYYYSLTATFRTNFPANIYIAEGTKVSTKYENDNPNSTLPEGTQYSKDAIAGAVRMSVVKSGEDKASFIWIPRPDIYLDYSDFDNPKVDILTAAEMVSKSTIVHQYYDTSKTLHNSFGGITYFGADAFTVSEGNYPEDGASSSMCVASTSGQPDEDGYYYCDAIINIWIEGCDAETRRVLSDGNFGFDLKFTAEEIQ
ncbi:MAG: hypothetical protein Q4B92_05755 [Ruminococcus sp.]|nr:hypothetical protein [Ruminococcus sp.]